METKNQDLEAIVTVSKAMNQSLDLDRILQIALDTVLKLKGLDADTIRLMDQESGSLVLKASRGFPPKAIKKLKKIKLGEKFSGIVAMTGEPVVVKDISAIPWLAEASGTRPDLKSLASVPLKSKDKTAGSINIYAPRADYFNQNVMQLLKALGIQIGIAVQNAKLLEQYKSNLKWSKHILSSSPFGIITLDTAGAILSLNNAAEKITGFSWAIPAAN